MKHILKILLLSAVASQAAITISPAGGGLAWATVSNLSYTISVNTVSNNLGKIQGILAIDILPYDTNAVLVYNHISSVDVPRWVALSNIWRFITNTYPAILWPTNFDTLWVTNFNAQNLVANNPILTNAMVYSSTSSNALILNNDPGDETDFIRGYQNNVLAFSINNGGGYTAYGGGGINADSVVATGQIQAAQVKYPISLLSVHDGAATNFTVSSDVGRYSIYATNGFSLTNFSGLEAGEGTTAKLVDLVLVGCSNAMPAVVLPTLGGSSYGVRVWTNDARPVITLLTNGVRVRYSMEFAGTNITLINCVTF